MSAISSLRELARTTAARMVERRRRRMTLRIIEGLPESLQKDIGWASGDSHR